MNEALPSVAVATVLLALGLWMMLPRGTTTWRGVGALTTLAALCIFAWLSSHLDPSEEAWLGDAVFFTLAGVTVIAAVCTVTFSNPGYSAIWFGLSLLGTAGLFLFQGAQFLGVATIVVYAGAILVTFLFVLMLAQPKGESAYDRLSWGAGLAALSGAVVVGILVLSILGIFQNPDVASRPRAPFELPELKTEILADQHVAHLGAQLFSKYLVAVEVAGTLLLVALVGAVAIAERIKKPDRGGQSHG